MLLLLLLTPAAAAAPVATAATPPKRHTCVDTVAGRIYEEYGYRIKDAQSRT